MGKLRPGVREAIKNRRAQHGDHATCPTCEMTVLVDPRSHPGRLTEHRPLPQVDICPASGWWRCYQCMDGSHATTCTFCAGAGWMAPVSGTSFTSNGGMRVKHDAPPRPDEVHDPS